jgi:hypothetical protein
VVIRSARRERLDSTVQPIGFETFLLGKCGGFSKELGGIVEDGINVGGYPASVDRQRDGGATDEVEVGMNTSSVKSRPSLAKRRRMSSAVN